MSYLVNNKYSNNKSVQNLINGQKQQIESEARKDGNAVIFRRHQPVQMSPDEFQSYMADYKPKTRLINSLSSIKKKYYIPETSLPVEEFKDLVKSKLSKNNPKDILKFKKNKSPIMQSPVLKMKFYDTDSLKKNRFGDLIDEFQPGNKLHNTSVRSMEPLCKPIFLEKSDSYRLKKRSQNSQISNMSASLEEKRIKNERRSKVDTSYKLRLDSASSSIG